MSQYSIPIPVAGPATVTVAAKTMLEITAGAADRVQIKKWWIEFDSSAANTPIKVELMRASAAITGTSITPVPIDAADGAANSTARSNASAEGTGTTVIETHYVPPNSGFIWAESLGDEIIVAVSGLLRIRTTSATGITPNCIAGFRINE